LYGTAASMIPAPQINFATTVTPLPPAPLEPRGPLLFPLKEFLLLLDLALQLSPPCLLMATWLVDLSNLRGQE